MPDPYRRSTSRARGSTSALILVSALAACSTAGGGLDPSDPAADLVCSIPSSEIFNGGPGKDGIPALTNPKLVGAVETGTAYLKDADRVVGLIVNGQAIAIPLNIFWWHEIVNLDAGGLKLAVTHCPLTGSSMAFDRAAIGGNELGVSGLLFQNNLIMYDRSSGESLWPQMLRGARCGPRDGTALEMVPILETTWAGWQNLHRDTRVVSSETEQGRDYTVYPYGRYDEPANQQLLFPLPGAVDSRRLPKERVLGIPLGATGGIAFPFGALDEMGPLAAVSLNFGGEPVVVLWERWSRTAMAYRPILDGQGVSLSVQNDRIVDAATGSVWRIDGSATQGTLAGRRLEPIADAYVAFWFAWAAFHPESTLWRAP